MLFNKSLLIFLVSFFISLVCAAQQTNTKKYPLAIATSNDLATQTGFAILEQGGSAVDAAIAVQMVLTLVKPQSSGIGGGGFLMFWDQAAEKTLMFDAREMAPLKATSDLFLDEQGNPLPFYDVAIGGRAVGVPGIIKMFELAHQRYGRLPWHRLFEPAIQLAEQGFEIGPRLASMIANDLYLPNEAVARAYFYHPDGSPKQEGEILINKEYAHTLKAIAKDGADAFYKGPIAQDIVKTVQGHAKNPGLLTLSDLNHYAPKIREPICSHYLKWEICGASPPASGGIAVGQILGILSHVPTRQLFSKTPGELNFNPQTIHLFTEAGRLAYADRDYYIADPDFVLAPGDDWHTMVDPDYLSRRAQYISPYSMGIAPQGKPAHNKVDYVMGISPELPSTSHFSIADQWGNVLSMTASLEDTFGSRQMVRGFMLNNQLTDFSFSPTDQNGVWVANRIEGHKRPRSSISSFIVFDQKTKRPIMAIGSAGGANIINHVAKTLMSNLYGKVSLQQAINLPNMGSRNTGPTELEIDRFSEATLAALSARQHIISEIEIGSGVQGIIREHAHKLSWTGANDPRREGTSLVE